MLFLAGEVSAQSAKKNASGGGRQAEVFRAIYPTAPMSLDPQGPPDEAAWPIIMACYDRLMTFKPGTAEPTLSLARRVIVSPNGLNYKFVLHEGMTFADGTVINADAVYYTFDRLMASEVGRRYYPHLYGFNVLGPHTFELKLRRPWPPFLASLALPMASLVSPGLKERPPEYLDDRTLGSGNYQVYDWKNDSIGLKLRPDLKTKLPVSFAIFHYEPDSQKRYEKMLAHNTHLTVEPALPADRQSVPAQFQSLDVPTFSVRYLAFNTRRPYTRQQNIRRAMGFLVSDIFKDHPGFMASPFPDGLFYNAPPIATAALSPVERLAQARNILREAGPPTGSLTLAHPSGVPGLVEDAVLIAQTLTAYGFSVNLVRLDGENGRKIMESGDYDLFLGTQTPHIPAADMWLGRFLDAGSPAESNPAFFNNSQVNQLIAEIADTVGKPNDGPNDIRRVEAERARSLASLAEIAMMESPYVFLYQTSRSMVVDERLANLRPHPVWPEIWPLDQSNITPVSLKSGVNPTGKRLIVPPAQDEEAPTSPTPAEGSSVTAPVQPVVPTRPAFPSPPTSGAAASPGGDALAAAPVSEAPGTVQTIDDDPYEHLPNEEELDYDDFYVPEDLLSGEQ